MRAKKTQRSLGLPTGRTKQLLIIGFSSILLVSLMFVGGCAGSTAGGMKIMRLAIGLKASFREVRLIFSPSTVKSVFIGGKAVPDAVVLAVASAIAEGLHARVAGVARRQQQPHRLARGQGRLDLLGSRQLPGAALAHLARPRTR